MNHLDHILRQAEDLLHTVFKHRRFRPGQGEILAAVLAGEHVLAIMPTGGGKSLCYQLPALLFDGLTLVVSPLIALMKDQVDQLHAKSYPASFINSTLTPEEIRERLREARTGRLKLLYVAPERFQSGYFIEQLHGMDISLFAIDEAHCISQWGHDFRPSYLQLRRAVDTLNAQRIMALTATATQRVRDDILQQLKLDNPKTFIAGFDRPNLRFTVKHSADKVSHICDYLRRHEGLGIVYAGTRKSVDNLVAALAEEKIKAAGYHAGMDLPARKFAQELFVNEKIRCIVATNAFGMGIDKSNVRFVLHTDMPGTLEAYYQEAGRAGRDDEPADCIIFYSPQDLFLQEFFIDNDNPEPGVVHDVYDTLRDAEVDVGQIIQWRSDEIARMLGENTTASLVNAALQFLAEIHYLTLIAPSPDTLYFKLTTSKTAPVIRQAPQPVIQPAPHAEKSEAQTATMLLNFLQEFAGDAPAAWHRLDLREPVRLLHLSRTRLMQDLEALAAQNLLQIAGPFKHRGILLSDPKRSLRFDTNILTQRRVEATVKLRQMQRYCELASCRRHFILDYFGESHASPRCENCDNCGIVWQTSAEATLLAQKILSCVVRMQERFGTKAVAEVLKGSSTDRSRNFAQLSTFGLLHDLPLKQIEKDIQRLIAAGYLARSDGQYPVLQVTPKGWEVLRGQRQAALPAPADERQRATSPRKIKGGTLLQTLQLLRQGLSIKEVAQARALEESTIWGHAKELALEGKIENLDAIILPQEVDEIASFLSKTDTLDRATIYDHLPQHHPSKVFFVRAILQARQRGAKI
ncbi:hypothetical protein DCC62_17295 [candidate division KSB1 bacterium]|nr:MAG: hypothetical protein DCC62_17295 [candidate division KSB1 bacterium]